MKKIFSILFALVLVVSLGLATVAPVLAEVDWTDIEQVDGGGFFMVGLKSDGTVVAVGDNSRGQCNVGGWTDIIQVDAGLDNTLGLKSDGTVVAVGDNDHGRHDVGGWTDITQVDTGTWHTVGLKSDGTVVAVGINDDLQCNVGNWTDIVQVDAGADNTVGLKSDGTVVTMGDNDYGRHDVGGWTNITQIATGVWHTLGLKSDGTVVTVGRNDYGQCNVGGWTDIVQIATGAWHTVGLKSDGTVVTVGNVVTETVTDGTVDAREEADTEVEVDGTATVTVARYEDNPGGDAPTDFSSMDKYIDVYVPDTTEANELEIRLYYTDAELAAKGIGEESLRPLWLNGDEWDVCSHSGVNTTSTNGYSGYMWAKIRATGTTPSLAFLQEQEFDGGYTSGGQLPGQGCGCFIATAAYGTDTAREIGILREFRDTVLLPNSLGAKLVSFYYKTSPPIADFISQHEVLRTVVRVGFVDPIVRILSWTHGLWSEGGSQ